MIGLRAWNKVLMLKKSSHVQVTDLPSRRRSVRYSSVRQNAYHNILAEWRVFVALTIRLDTAALPRHSTSMGKTLSGRA